MKHIKDINNNLIALASAIDRLDYAVKSKASDDHLKLWTKIIKWRLEGLSLIILCEIKPSNLTTKRLNQVEISNLPTLFCTGEHQ